MAKGKAITDEEITAALLANGTIRGAAAAVGLSERAIYNRMQTGDFQAVYRAAKIDLIRAAVFSINNRLQEAIDTVAAIMRDDTNNPAIRLQAAQTILNNAGKFAQRLQADETGVIRQIDSNKFDNMFSL